MSVTFKSTLLSTLALTLAFSLSSAASADALTENFDDGLPTGWTVNNLSSPAGSTSWFQGSPTVFDAHQGAANSYLAANFNNGSSVSDISTWLILPTSTYRNGDTLSFFTRTADLSIWPDNLEVRFSNVGGSDVGNSAGSVGTFSTLRKPEPRPVRLSGNVDAIQRHPERLVERDHWRPGLPLPGGRRRTEWQ